MKKLTCLLALFLMIFAANSYAQFEGKISYILYELDDSGEKEEEKFTLFITPQRILVQSDEAFGMPGSFKTQGLLIRLDKKDFVFLTGDKTAMSITKSGITSMMNMFGAMAEQGQEEIEEDINSNFTFNNTGETDTFAGYDVEKFVFKPNDRNEKVVLWMTNDINIHWGMLAEPWGESLSFMTDENVPKELVFQENYLPLRATFYEDGQIKGGMTAEIETTDIAREMVQISPDVQVRSLSEYMFQMMRQQQ